MPEIGPYTLHAIETGRFALDGGAMFGIIPKPLWEQRIAPDARNRIPLHMRCLLVQGHGRCILIDSGIGDKYGDKFAGIYAIDHAFATLQGSLDHVGVAPEDVTDVILTHLHFDHCGGSTQRRSDGTLELTFPNAQHYVQHAHWEWAQAPNAREKGSFLDENLAPLAESGQLQFTDGEEELFPGITVHPVHGHTEAQQTVKISDGGENTLVFVADLLPTTAHLAPAWNMAYDVRPLMTIDEKMDFLTDAVDHGWDLFFEHDPEVVVASVKRTERGIEPVDRRPLTEL
ncbi:MAG: MBL fold metallo-hydrolase [Bacteroidetes bacterium]|nr:MBL fold metallo-hydrolase [Bacteroidota bacterium]